MSLYTLYTDDVWKRYVEKHGVKESEFKLKTYPQFDPHFNFFKKSGEIKRLVSDPTLKKVAKHSFIPFVKILVKTPRYRFQENENISSLETKIRPISFASHFDTYLYGFYSFALTEKYQQYIRKKDFHECVLAYRSDLDGKCNIQFAKEVFDQTKALIEKTSTTAIALDISGYFDNIDHQILKEKWLKIISIDAQLKELPLDQYKVFRSLTKYSYASKNSILKHFKVDLVTKIKRKEKWHTLLDLIPDSFIGPLFNDKLNLLRKKKLVSTNLPKIDKKGAITFRGIPQGSPMSALLSNIYLIDFDEWLYKLSRENRFVYRRYCDDLLIICDSSQSDSLNKLILKEIEKYNLIIQEKKTITTEFKVNSKGKIRSFDKNKLKGKVALSKANEQRYYKNLQYLGFEFNGESIYIRPGSLSRYFRKMKARVFKTVSMAYSDKSKSAIIHKKQLYERYSHFGTRNFITYAQNAAKKEYANAKGAIKDGMNSPNIKRQLSAHFSQIEIEVKKTNLQRYKDKQAAFEKKSSNGKKAKVVIYKKY